MYKASCLSVQLLTAVAESLQVYYNYTGTTSCFNVSQTAVSSLGATGWNFQVRYFCLVYLIVLMKFCHCYSFEMWW